MPNPPRQESEPKPHILLDTNILQYLNNQNLAEHILDYMDGILNSGYYQNFAISDISFFEALSGIPKSKERILSSTLGALPRFDVNLEICIIAAQITTAYRIEKAEFQNIEPGDKIIAATSFKYKCPILTANCNDFPRPFFIELHKKRILYTEKSRECLLSVYLLYPDFDQLIFRYNDRK